MNFRENEDAVSPVIGVILMVAITVILAAVIAAFVFGMAGSVDTQKNVAIGVKQVATNNLQVTVQGGQDLPELQYLKVTIDGGTAIYTIDGQSTLEATTAVKVVTSSLSVGEVFTAAGLSDSNDHVVVVGHFNDGKEQLLIDTNI
ncbi:hypothetical protein ABH15_11660 [Methanoculleus taiwanensis]|uniref:Archaeal Type IV pilin N-terminal domain-containing protein n=1 Tax=Methanoculleus taiwanensis TaxID=1550565 RepID=A0A498GZ29_9EURY|nr:type IV pilin N-terminal domain-containing protein [Methanoculleus taiwanensis]RXE55397.1 hypothetical protein ABH15_11660 [Methanoculleus taiwanensis]